MTWLRTATVMLLSFATTILLAISFTHNTSDPIIGHWQHPECIEMPIVHSSTPLPANFQEAPQEDRGPEYRRWLSPSVKIRVSGASGSGTICYYDSESGWAYVISCGHLWSGSKSFEGRPNGTAKIITWYHNGKKLDEPREYEAEVLFWSNVRGKDCSGLRFKPDWEPDFFPIAPLDYPINTGDHFHSVGCDGGREVARYDVEFVEFRGSDLITRKNSPRPGRSGGGLLSNDGWYVAICWGTSDTRSGGGIGYFTPLRSIHEVYAANGHGWLLEVGQGRLAQRIPIHDWLYPGRTFQPDFIPVPGGNRVPLKE